MVLATDIEYPRFVAAHRGRNLRSLGPGQPGGGGGLLNSAMRVLDVDASKKRHSRGSRATTRGPRPTLKTLRRAPLPAEPACAL